MSNDALDWAWRQRTGSSTRKAVLVSMADRAGERHHAYPSLERLEFDTELNRKTIIKALDRLEADGFIRDTGKRIGRTGNVKVYKLLGVVGRDEEVLKESQNRNGSKSGTVPELDENGPNSGTPKGSNFGTQNPRGTQGEPKPGTYRGTYPQWFEDLWAKVPKRAGSQGKKAAYQGANARLAEGYTVEDMDAGLIRYARFCQATGKIGTEKVLMAKTFFGPEDPPHFLNDWTPPAASSGGSHADVMAEITGDGPKEAIDGEYARTG